MNDVYQQYENERDKYTRSVLGAVKKGELRIVIAAGPGTGKTFLFSEIIKEKVKSLGDKKILVATFINALVNDLSLDLYKFGENVEVSTLHSLALRCLGSDFTVDPRLPDIIAEDRLIFNNESINPKSVGKKKDELEKLFETMQIRSDKCSGANDFYQNRRSFYKRTSFNGIVLDLVDHLEEGTLDIPCDYGMVIIDEFQDFCPLEARLVTLLGSVQGCQLVIAGDDDQIVYEKATPDLLRKIYNSSENSFKRFTLPYCSRCTKCIVSFVNSIILKAKKINLLKGRIDKNYLYFKEKKKDKISNMYDKVSVHKGVLDRQIPDCINRILKDRRMFDGNSSVMIISPSHRIETMHDLLIKQGFENIKVRIREKKNELLYGLGILLKPKNQSDNMGWRIIVKEKLSEEKFKSVILESMSQNKNIEDVVEKEFKKEVKSVLTALRKLRKDGVDNLNEGDINTLSHFLETSKHYLVFVGDFIKKQDSSQPRPNYLKSVPITITTAQSSKGLSSDFVFITHFDEKYIFKNKTDKEICSILVSVTRAKKKLFLINTDGNPPLISDMDPDLFDMR